jgi:alpha-tubulin suppressor-like RCC1 family protein
MPIVSRLAAMTSRAWGQFKVTAASLAGNYLYVWGQNSSAGNLGIGLISGSAVARSSPVAVAINKTFVEVGANSHVVAVDSSGQLWAWGPNSVGQLGDGTTTAKSSPVQIGTLTDWDQIEVATQSVLAIKTDNSLWAWGANGSGRLGDGTSINKSSPVQIGTLTDWSIVGMALGNAAAVKTDGTLWVWGAASSGALGNGTTTPNVSSPIQVGTLATWSTASAGNSFAHAISNTGNLWGWGINTSGQLGDGTATNKSSPVQIGALSDWSVISAGSLSWLAIKTDGTLWSCGSNIYGQIGDGTTTNRSSPVQIGTLNTWVEIDINAESCSARRSDGTVWVWGRNGSGQLGLSDSANRSSPTQLGTRSDYTKISVGTASSLFVTSDNYNWSAFVNTASGQIGASSNNTPLPVATLTTKYADVQRTDNQMTAVSTDGKLWTWGLNNAGQLGNGTTNNESLPTQVGTLTTWASTTKFGQSTPGAIKSDGTLWTWGYNNQGNLGNSTWGTADQYLYFPTPFTDRQYSDFSYGTAAYFISNGALYACGNNNYYEVGDGTTVWRSSPVQIGTQTDWSKVSAGSQFGLAIKTDGTLWSWGIEAGLVQGPEVTNLANTVSFSSPVLIPITFGSLPEGVSYFNALALSINNYMFAWGRNSEYECGDGTLTKVTAPKMIGTLTWSQTSSGNYHSLAIGSDNTLWAWGYNNSGQLGLNDTDSRSFPVQVGTLSDYSKIAGGRTTSYFIRSGQLWATGANNLGQLGDGTTTNRSSPVQIGTLNNWSQVFATEDWTTFAIKTDGTLWAWGSNNYGQIGDNTSTNRSSPVQIGTLTTWATVSNGGYSALAVKNDGTLWAWGYNGSGQLGDGTITSKSSPVQIGTLTNWSRAYLGTSHAVAVKTDGTIWSWGGGSYGQLGTGSTVARSSPVQIGTLTNWTQAVASNLRSFFLNTSGEVWGCGDNVVSTAGGPYPGLGLSGGFFAPVPLQVGTDNTWADISAGQRHSLLRKNDKSLWSAGGNQYGQLGQGDTVSNYRLRQVGTLTNWDKLAASGGASGSDGSSFAIKDDNTLWSWGMNTNGVLGLGDTTDRSSPVQIGTLSNWSKIKLASDAAGAINAIKTDGTLWAWGRNSDGQLGLNDTTSRSSPVQVGTLTDWAYAFGAYQNSYFVKTDNTLWAVGKYYQLGDGTTVDKSSPVQIGTGYSGLLGGSASGDTSFQNIGVGVAQKTDNTIASWGYGYAGPSNNYSTPPAYIYSTSISSPVQIGTLTNWVSGNLKDDGTLWTWGLNQDGQLGLGDTFTRLSPTQVGTLTDWRYIEASYNANDGFMGALRTNNTLWMWGNGVGGRLGNGSTAAQSVPVQVGTLTNWSNIALGNSHTVAVKTDGTLWAWGLGSSGQIGNGSTASRSSPVQIGTLTSWVDVWATSTTSYAIKNDGTIWAWGLGTSGQLGDGTNSSKSSPVQTGTLTTWAGGIKGPGNSFTGAFSTV